MQLFQLIFHAQQTITICIHVPFHCHLLFFTPNIRVFCCSTICLLICRTCPVRQSKLILKQPLYMMVCGKFKILIGDHCSVLKWVKHKRFFCLIRQIGTIFCPKIKNSKVTMLQITYCTTLHIQTDLVRKIRKHHNLHARLNSRNLKQKYS